MCEKHSSRIFTQVRNPNIGLKFQPNLKPYARRWSARFRRFLQHARSDRFFTLWVDAGTLSTEITRVVVDGRVIELDGKQCVQTGLEADHQVASTPAELIIGGALASMEIGTGQGAA